MMCQINDVINSYYPKLLALCNKDFVISDSYTDEDILNSAVITTLKKYKDYADVDAEEVREYLKTRFLTEKKFYHYPNHRNTTQLVYGLDLSNLTGYN